MIANKAQNEHGRHKWRAFLLRGYAGLIAYRFAEQLGPPLKVYGPYESRPLFHQQVQEKAKASLTTSGVFFGFSIALLAALIAGEKSRDRLGQAWAHVGSWKYGLIFLSIMISPYWLIWQERFISAASGLEGKGKADREQIRMRRYHWLWPALLLSLLVPAALPSVIHPAQDTVLQDVFSLSGFCLIVVSAFLLLLSLEFYDYAAGWRHGKDLHFHLASLASHSMSFGVSLALVGVSLLVCLLSFWMGRIVTCLSLVVLFAMPEIERQLGDWRASLDLPRPARGGTRIGGA